MSGEACGETGIAPVSVSCGLEKNSLSKGRNKEFIWSKPRLLALFPQNRGRIKYWFQSKNPSSIARVQLKRSR